MDERTKRWAEQVQADLERAETREKWVADLQADLDEWLGPLGEHLAQIDGEEDA